MTILSKVITRIFGTADKGPPTGSYAATDIRAGQMWSTLDAYVQSNGDSDSTRLVKAVLSRQAKAKAPSVGVPDIGFKGARQQLFQRFNLVDLYAMAHNNSALKTATLALKQEVFRRGMRWDPAFDFRCGGCGTDYTTEEAEEASKQCPNCAESGSHDGMGRGWGLHEPDPAQRVRLEAMMPRANLYGQSFVRLLQSLEDDANIADDMFLFLASEYTLSWTAAGEERIGRQVRQMFRLDPVFVEFDTDEENRPGFAHHICLGHRDNLLTIPSGGEWEHEWKGQCPIDGHTTFPVIYRYNPYRGVFGSQLGGPGPERQAMYLVQGEVAHSSKFSPSELFGYSPVLSIYEKVLSLIGMDRYLYDYFFERQVPQGVITTVTDNPEDLETRKAQMLADVLENPHHIPWLAVSSKNGQGRTEFIRFAYSLDELQFLPVQDAMEKAVGGVYGVPDLFMGGAEGGGGLNNESQQLTRMSRGARLSQDVYNTELLPQVLKAFGITDWELVLVEAEERGEQIEWEVKQSKAQWAATNVSMGFGATYDAASDTYTIIGDVKPMSEQQEQQGGFGGFGGGFGDMGGEEGGDMGGEETGLPEDGGIPDGPIGGQAGI